MTAPKNAVVLLLDSLNRHLIGAYGGREFDTPNLDRLAQRGMRFTRHYSGSLPCIPARHDLLCGSLDFPWRPWGSVEIWERPLTAYVHRAGVVTQLISDHPHLFENGGENYHSDFYGWEYLRGHESDPWQTVLDETMVGTPSYHRPRDTPYHRNRRLFREEPDFPGAKTMAAAAHWLDENARAHQRFFLLVDEFDPHEPFDTPEPYASMYDPAWQGPKQIWPPYLMGELPERQARQLRAQYGGKLTFIDRWLGRVLDALDRNDLWESTLVVLLTDHGHYLGEHGCWGKPPAPVYATLGHIPMIACMPGVQGGTTSDALTTTVDVCETLLDLYGITHTRQARHGKSLLPLLRGEVASVRSHVLQGYWGQRVNVIDRERKYSRRVVRPDALCIYSNRWSTMPPIRLPDPDERAVLGPFMPGSRIPVIRQPLDAKQVRSLLWSAGEHATDRLFRPDEDPGEEHDLSDDPTEVRAAEELLRGALTEIQAPREQLTRLGLA